jgi:hypothetical protein
MKKLINIFLFCALSFSSSAALSHPFKNAIGRVESSNNLNAKGDYINGIPTALGIYQVHLRNFQDCQRFNPLLKQFKYQDCVRRDVSDIVLDTYLHHYEPVAYQKGDWETLSRRWNGGNWRRNKSATDNYWKKVKKEMDN